MRFNICVGTIKGGLNARKKKKIRVYVCIGAIQGSYARKEETLKVFFKKKTLKNINKV